MIIKAKDYIIDIEKLFMAFFALSIVVATFWLGYVVLTHQIPINNRDTANVLLGVLFGLSGQVVGYYYKSSKGSKDKTEILDRAMDSLANQNKQYDEYGEGES